MALLTDQPRSATVLAEGDGEVLRLDSLHFDGLVRANPSVPLALAATLSTRLGGSPLPPQAQPPVIAEPVLPGSLRPAHAEAERQAGVGAHPRGRLSRLALALRPLCSRVSLGFCLAAALLACGWLVPQPSGFTLEAWHAAARFLAIVPLMAFGCLPDGAIALVLAAAWVLGGVAKPRVALAGFASGTWVLTIAVFVVGAVITSSGLLFRLAHCGPSSTLAAVSRPRSPAS